MNIDSSHDGMQDKNADKPIYIIENACNGCGACQGVCDSDAIEINDNIAQIDYDRCTLCMMCLKACPGEAVKLSKQNKDADVSNYKDVWVYIEFRNKKINPACLQILSTGYELAKKLKYHLNAVVIGNSFENTEDIKTIWKNTGLMQLHFYNVRILISIMLKI